MYNLRRQSAALAGAACLLLFGCSSGTPPESKEVSSKPVQVGPVPDTYRASFETGKGVFVVQVTRAWAPRGADRFYELAKSGFYDGDRFFRVLPRFVVQFGINGDPAISRLWSSMRIPDDPVKHSNTKGTITFATSGPQSRTTQVFVNLRDNERLDESGFAPFGEVVSGMDVVERLYSGYGEGAPNGAGPDQTKVELEGNSYLEAHFPRLDYIKKLTIEQ